jgi:hypothetical protein
LASVHPRENSEVDLKHSTLSAQRTPIDARVKLDAREVGCDDHNRQRTLRRVDVRSVNSASGNATFSASVIELQSAPD